MLFYSRVIMRDLVRNYRLLLKGKNDDESDAESQPLTSSGASSPPNRSFGSVDRGIFRQDSDSDDDGQEATISPQMAQIPSILLQKKLNRKLLFPSSYETPELDAFDDIREKYETRDGTNERRLSRNILSGSYDYLGPEKQTTHSSLVTIFAIWNTTVGTSLLSMSWGIEKTGLFPAILINMAIAAICLYTTYTLLKVNEKHGVVGQAGEVCDLCRALIGRWAEIVAKIFSLVVLIGANIVYWILMSNFFYNSVHFFYGSVLHLEEGTTSNATVICPKNASGNQTAAPSAVSMFDQIWDLHSTVPIILALIMFPMLNWKSPTFFTKFNSVGTLSVLYLILFVAIKAGLWGIHMADWGMETELKSTFCALSGMLSLSYFIHNIIISIMRNNQHQKHNGRDLSIAFGLITFTYLFIGVLFYVSFPLPKFCIEDNILNNFDKYDMLTIIARVLLLFQLFTVFPLMTYMLRSDIFANIGMITKNGRLGEFSYGKVIVINVAVLTVCVLFACFLPRIGTLIRYTGALSGLVYIFMLPSLLKIASLRKEGALTPPQLIFHAAIMTIGFLNLICQFFISDK